MPFCRSSVKQFPRMKTIATRAKINGCLMAIILVSQCSTVTAADFSVVNNGSGSYSINSLSNPGLTLHRGTTYTFQINANNHPFWIKTVQGNGNRNGYAAGVANNGVQVGILTLVLPTNAPSTLYYNCENDTPMTGVITVINPPVPPAPRILDLAVGTNLNLRFIGSNTFSYFPEYKTNLANTNWFALTVTKTNATQNGTNDVICGKPPGNTVFIRIRAQ